MYHVGGNGKFKSTTKHHCPKKGKGEGNCHKTATHCKTHQEVCSIHNSSHLKSEECSKCKTKRIEDEKKARQKAERERADRQRMEAAAAEEEAARRAAREARPRHNARG
ncbi:MAG: hypothetical protein LQ338_002938 [Usnochroma carphineum]|nr:MAG: hypothetical protein LQ338_002938 [Usnochroma carphineum]